jgi:hypothetical protein
MKRVTLLLAALVLLVTPVPADAQYIGMNTDSTLNVTLVMYDQFGNPMCCLPLSLTGQAAQQIGGHFHSLSVGSIQYRFARLNPTTCNTGPSAFGCQVTITSLAAGGGYDVIAYVTGGPHAGQWFVASPGINIGAYQGADISRFEWYGVPGTYMQVGQTTPHPENHWCLYWVCAGLAQLAYDYNATWNLVIAYNDMSLRKGGLFDISATWMPPHSTHRTGNNADVRANTAPNAIPHDPTIRSWFVNRVIQIFGVAPLLEAPGTANEHYHIFSS